MSRKIRAILVDDEERARNVLSSLLRRHCHQVEILDSCSNVISAVESIKTHNPDVLFLDIEMPMYAGYEITDVPSGTDTNDMAVGMKFTF